MRWRPNQLPVLALRLKTASSAGAGGRSPRTSRQTTRPGPASGARIRRERFPRRWPARRRPMARPDGPRAAGAPHRANDRGPGRRRSGAACCASGAVAAPARALAAARPAPAAPGPRWPPVGPPRASAATARRQSRPPSGRSRSAAASATWRRGGLDLWVNPRGPRCRGPGVARAGVCSFPTTVLYLPTCRVQAWNARGAGQAGHRGTVVSIVDFGALADRQRSACVACARRRLGPCSGANQAAVRRAFAHAGGRVRDARRRAGQQHVDGAVHCGAGAGQRFTLRGHMATGQHQALA